jgi:hypothetical protein
VSFLFFSPTQLRPNKSSRNYLFALAQINAPALAQSPIAGLNSNQTLTPPAAFADTDIAGFLCVVHAYNQTPDQLLAPPIPGNQYDMQANSSKLDILSFLNQLNSITTNAATPAGSNLLAFSGSNFYGHLTLPPQDNIFPHINPVPLDPNLLLLLPDNNHPLPDTATSLIADFNPFRSQMSPSRAPLAYSSLFPSSASTTVSGTYDFNLALDSPSNDFTIGDLF